MKLLKIFQKIWLAAAALAIFFAVTNAWKLQSFNYKVYFPLICAVFCGIVYWNLGKQIRFKEEIDNKKS